MLGYLPARYCLARLSASCSSGTKNRSPRGPSRVIREAFRNTVRRISKIPIWVDLLSRISPGRKEKAQSPVDLVPPYELPAELVRILESSAAL